MVDDTIEREILVKASVEKVWSVLTGTEFLGMWFGNGDPVKLDLRPGGLLLFDHGIHGAIPARIATVEEPRRLAWRWSQGAAGEEPTDENATLVEFTLETDEQAGGTRVRLVESGFSTLALPADELATRYQANSQNWPGKLAQLREYIEQQG
jgi:uncharacterized protein YndB with AHSA1/START domain